MNYYHRYCGDYIKKTLDLTMVEDGAYTRLLDWLYANERPIEHSRRYNIARCQTPVERKAVDRVLDQYFDRNGDHWTHERAIEEIKEARPRIEAAQENGKKGGRPKGSKTKPKDEPKNEPKNEPSEKPSGFLEENPEATHSESSPYPIPHTLNRTPPHIPPLEAGDCDQDPGCGVSGFTPTPAGLACKAIKAKGIASVNPGNQTLKALLDAGATIEEFEGWAEQAKSKATGNAFLWMLSAMVNERTRAADIAKGLHKGSLKDAKPQEPWHETPKGVIAMGEKLGCGTWNDTVWQNTGEQYGPYRLRVIAAARKAGEPMEEVEATA